MLLKFINQNNSYPEADYLIGRVYKLEGEPTLAAVYMKRAYEASDLLYHLIVLLTAKGLRIEDVVRELQQRHDPNWDKKRREAKAAGDMK